jgi:uncharacterized protein
MSLTPTYPGVYVVELPSPVKPIIGVSTSTTAFIGRARQGPTDGYRPIHSFSDYIRTYGGLDEESYMSYAVYQYFLNGGNDAIIIRAVNNAKKATFSIGSLVLEAANEGIWANDLELTVDTDKINKQLLLSDPTTFKLTVERVIYNNTGKKNEERNVITSEVFENLSTDITQTQRFITNILNKQSNLVQVPKGAQVQANQPAAQKYPVSDKGSDGDPLTDIQINNPDDANAGLGMLNKVDIFNMLCIPPYNGDIQTATSTSKEVYDAALAICKDRRAMLIVDPPDSWSDKDNARTGVSSGDFVERDQNAAVWFPKIFCPDPLDPKNQSRPFVPSGAVAGVIARTDANRGVWKAPAGIEATLIGLSGLQVNLNDKENGELNPLGINCLRFFSVAGRVVWGARTLRGADELTDQWKYLPVRRTALFIEESLYRGLKWVVFEPNDYRLWGEIRLNVGAFMHDLFRKGAFQGSDPRKAYFVKCDDETTTQDDIDRGIVNILVGFAPLKPAEFVVLQIQQITQQPQEGAG